MFCLRSLTDLVKPVSLCSLCRMWTESLNFTPPILHDNKTKEWCHLRHLFSEVPRQQFQLEHPPKSDFWKSPTDLINPVGLSFVCCHISPIHQSYPAQLLSVDMLIWSLYAHNGEWTWTNSIMESFRAWTSEVNGLAMIHLNLWLNCWWLSCIMGNVGTRFWQGRRIHEMRKDNLAGSAAYFFFLSYYPLSNMILTVSKEIRNACQLIHFRDMTYCQWHISLKANFAKQHTPVPYCSP